MSETPTLNQRTEAFAILGEILRDCAGGKEGVSILHQMADQSIERSLQHNPWFMQPHLNHALFALGSMLTPEKLKHWVSSYNIRDTKDGKRLNIGVIMAGNIPAVGFHDFFCVLMSGNNVTAKLSSDDPFLIPAFAQILKHIHKGFAHMISFTEDKKLNLDAIIATGSNNTARYFEYLYAHKPHIFRKNRNAIAVLGGHETQNDLLNLATDVFMHFGLGCRSVSKLYVPVDYDFKHLMNALRSGGYLAEHTAYMHNYRYAKAVLQMQGIEFFDTGFLLLLHADAISSQIATLHYDYYKNSNQLHSMLAQSEDQIQCVAGDKMLYPKAIEFGRLQQPGPGDYADGIDTMEFIAIINEAFP